MQYSGPDHDTELRPDKNETGSKYIERVDIVLKTVIDAGQLIHCYIQVFCNERDTVFWRIYV